MSHEIKLIVSDELHKQMQVNGLNYQTDPNGYTIIALQVHIELLRRISNGDTILVLPESGEMRELKFRGGLFEEVAENDEKLETDDLQKPNFQRFLVFIPILIALSSPLIAFLLYYLK
jgi:hypothetical protein